VLDSSKASQRTIPYLYKHLALLQASGDSACDVRRARRIRRSVHLSETSRRSFVNYLLGTSLGATALSILYPITQFLIPPAISEAQQNNVVAAKAAELKPKSGKIFK